jgi:hypothetical protein
MNSHWGSAPDTSLTDYITRNAMWLRPAVATLLVCVFRVAQAGIDPQLAAALPSWLTPASSVASVAGAAAVGLGASMTDTTSAAIVRIVGFGAALGLMLLYMFR